MTRPPPRPVELGKFGCTNCAYRWTSARAQRGVYQKCKYCMKQCYPTDFFWSSANKRGNMDRETFVGHNTDLCGKCEELGYSCQSMCEEEGEEEEEPYKILLDNIDFPPARLSQKERKKLPKIALEKTKGVSQQDEKVEAASKNLQSGEIDKENGGIDKENSSEVKKDQTVETGSEHPEKIEI